MCLKIVGIVADFRFQLFFLFITENFRFILFHNSDRYKQLCFMKTLNFVKYAPRTNIVEPPFCSCLFLRIRKVKVRNISRCFFTGIGTTIHIFFSLVNLNTSKYIKNIRYLQFSSKVVNQKYMK